MLNGMIIDAKDNVGVAIESIKKGEVIRYVNGNKKIDEIEAIEDLQIYHKFAIYDIAKDQPIIKYGQHIGHAARPIMKGEHVHVHNVKSVREDLQHRGE